MKMDTSSGPKEYWEKRLRENYSLDGTGFQTLGKNYNKWMYRIRKAIVKRSIKRTLSGLNGMDVFDIGSGTGFYIEMWMELGARRVVGSDITDVAVQNLRRNYLHNQFYRLDIGEGGLPDQLGAKKFQIISAFDVLFHIVDDVRYRTAMANINSLLGPGGYFFFSDNFLHRDALRSHHQVSRPLVSIERILQETGFKILDRIPMFVIMNAPVDTRNRFLPLTWKLITSTARRGEFASNATGCVLYPIELFLTSIGKEGPSTEMMICKKVESCA
jgi:2-polyprenyl-3-methyl-5-hydroxy-6-metoxy-1,4-benzoquinol methylase